MSRHAGIRDALAPGAAHGVTLRGSDPQATRLMCSQGQLVWVIMYNIWPKVRVLTPYDNLSNPVVMTEGARGGGICTRAACPCILPLSRPCVTLSCLLIGRRHEIVLHHSRGNSASQRERRRDSRTVPRGRSRWPRRVQNMQRSPDPYWAGAKYDWQRAAITLDPESCCGEAWFVCTQMDVKQTVLAFKHGGNSLGCTLTGVGGDFCSMWAARKKQVKTNSRRRTFFFIGSSQPSAEWGLLLHLKIQMLCFLWFYSRGK